MTARAVLTVTAGMAYLLVTGWAMNELSYDIWGAFIVAPVLALASAPLIRRAFHGELESLVPIAWIGLAAKCAGAILGYVVRFDAYGGSADAGRYHDVGRTLAAEVRSGVASPISVLPTGTSTRFIEDLTGAVYTVFGSSRLGGFLVFTWFSYWGLVFVVKAAATAIPGFATRRYALLVFLVPSLLYWGSSIGKEAVLGAFLGLAAYGAAILLTDPERQRAAILYSVIGLAGAARIRPHFAAIWAGALVIGLFVKFALDLVRNDDTQRRSRFGVLVLLGVAGVGFVLISSATLSLLDPPDDSGDVATAAVTDRVTSIFEQTEEQTGQGGSSFDVIEINGPQDWPYAAVRTLTRPLLIEARGVAQLLPALEMTFLIGLALVERRRFANLPYLLMRTPYVVYVLLCVGTFGVAFASIGNLGILVRQRSLVLSLLLVLWCLPIRGRRHDAERTDGRVEELTLPGPIGLIVSERPTRQRSAAR